ncbi:MAG: hypothetical protein M3O82_07585 [Verrucomicrobiota bacterium]|nr:hypothetical protein [Verrucomicrobiota bacterium]
MPRPFAEREFSAGESRCRHPNESSSPAGTCRPDVKETAYENKTALIDRDCDDRRDGGRQPGAWHTGRRGIARRKDQTPLRATDADSTETSQKIDNEKERKAGLDAFSVAQRIAVNFAERNCFSAACRNGFSFAECNGTFRNQCNAESHAKRGSISRNKCDRHPGASGRAGHGIALAPP